MLLYTWAKHKKQHPLAMHYIQLAGRVTVYLTTYSCSHYQQRIITNLNTFYMYWEEIINNSILLTSGTLALDVDEFECANGMQLLCKNRVCMHRTLARYGVRVFAQSGM